MMGSSIVSLTYGGTTYVVAKFASGIDIDILEGFGIQVKIVEDIHEHYPTGESDAWHYDIYDKGGRARIFPIPGTKVRFEA